VFKDSVVHSACLSAIAYVCRAQIYLTVEQTFKYKYIENTSYKLTVKCVFCEYSTVIVCEKCEVREGRLLWPLYINVLLYIYAVLITSYLDTTTICYAEQANSFCYAILCLPLCVMECYVCSLNVVAQMF